MIHKKSTGYHALPLREKYFSEKDAYLKLQLKKKPSIDITNHKISTENPNDVDFAEDFHRTAKEFFDSHGKEIIYLYSLFREYEEAKSS